MNKIFLVALLTLLGYSLRAQPRIESHITGWFLVNSYHGSVASNLVNVPIHIDWNDVNTKMQKWSVTFRVTNPIVNSEGKIFPADRLRFRLNTVNGNMPNDSGLYPTIAHLNPFTQEIPFQFTNSFLVNQSPYSLEVKKRYFVMNLQYDVTSAPGAYLEPLVSWQNYRVNIVMELWNAENQRVSMKTLGFDMGVRPGDSPPLPVQNSLIIDGVAKNVLLEFKTPADYANGVSKTLSRALSVTATSGYSITVHSVHQNLTSSSNRLLPVNLIRLTSKDHTSQATTGTIQLSAASQPVASSNIPALTPKFYDLTYSTKAGEESFFNHSYEQYSGTLIFSLIPL